MRPQHNLASAATMKQKMAQKPCLHEVNKHFKRPLHEKIVCHQARQKGAQRGSLHGVNDRLSTFLTQYGGKIALVQRSL